MRSLNGLLFCFPIEPLIIDYSQYKNIHLDYKELGGMQIDGKYGETITERNKTGQWD
jgi:hypothetical protein